MAAWHQQPPTATSQFRTCMQELHQTAAHLQEIEGEMTETLRRMKAEGHNREQLLVAGLVVANLCSVSSQLSDTGCLPDGVHLEQRQALAG